MKETIHRKALFSRDTLTRREWLERLGQMGLAVPLAVFGAGNLSQSSRQPLKLTTLPWSPYTFSAEEEKFLDELERATCLFFVEQASQKTGQVMDRQATSGSGEKPIASIAATGFGLTALCIGDHRGYIPSQQARAQALTTLRFTWEHLPHLNGFYNHFLDMDTGERMSYSEVSSIDTSLLLCGVLTCRQHFDDAEIKDLAKKIYERADWKWLLNGKKTLSHGWRDGKFLKPTWDYYCELMMIYLLALGSPTHPIPAECWDAWRRPVFDYYGLRYIGSPAPLFVHQYSQAWFDFRGKRDHYADYFQNSLAATEAHRRFCLELRTKFPKYSDDLWGISASDSVGGYVAWGGPPPMGPLDGSIVPCAAAGSLPFMPRETLRVLRTIRERFGERAWGRYGFVDAFNPHTNWYNPDVIGIDLGVTLLMAENARTQFVWKTFMKDPDMQRGMQRAGFRSTSG